MTLTREVWIAFDSFTASGYRTAIFLPPSISLASIFPIGATHLSNRCHPPFQSVPPTNWRKFTTIGGNFDDEQMAGKAALFSESERTHWAQPCDVSIFPIGATHLSNRCHPPFQSVPPTNWRKFTTIGGEFRRRADGGESSTVQRVGKDASGSALQCEGGWKIEVEIRLTLGPWCNHPTHPNPPYFP